jgi:hypothetical protein
VACLPGCLTRALHERMTCGAPSGDGNVWDHVWRRPAHLQAIVGHWQLGMARRGLSSIAAVMIWSLPLVSPPSGGIGLQHHWADVRWGRRVDRLLIMSEPLRASNLQDFRSRYRNEIPESGNSISRRANGYFQSGCKVSSE